MLIDWFTVIAQVFNFLILVWLLKRFLYKPILDAVDAREKRIAAELADADSKRTEAQQERDEFRRKNEAFEQQRVALLSQASEEAKAERQRLLDEARKAADDLSAKRQETLRSEARSLNQALARRVEREVFAIARSTLTDLASANLEQCIAGEFIRRLHEMDAEAKADFGTALKRASEPALIRSAFELPAEQRALIQQALNGVFLAEPSASPEAAISVRFETSPDLISGIELSTTGQKLAWSIADYLASLEKGVNELLKGKAPEDVPRRPVTGAEKTP